MTSEVEKKFLSFTKKNGFDITESSSNQHKAVLSDSYSVLPAGAGSGKTTVLTYRFLRLIMDDEKDIHSDEILTITFTRAATSSMRAKIYLILKKARNEGLIDEEEIERFTNAEISTTDSFCSKIVRLDSVRYGLSPSFAIEDDDDLKAFISLTLKEIIEDKIEKEEECRVIASLIPFDDLLSLFITVTHNYINIASPFPSDSIELYGKTKAEAKKIIEREKKKTKDILTSLTSTFLTLFSSCTSIKDDVEHVNNIKNYLITGEEINTSFTKKRTIKERPDKNNDFVSLRKDIKEKLTFYFELESYSDEESFLLLKGYSSLLTEFQNRIISHKRKEGLLTFHDIVLLSIDILKTNPSLRHYYNNKYKRIMVDEFQDNNEENKRLIYLLAASSDFTSTDRYPTINDIIVDKIFMVGDEKQSIYKFRGADVSVFKNIKNDLGEDRVLPLSENFRSEKGLIEKINTIFNSKIMPAKEEESADYEAEYTPLTSRKERVRSTISFRYMNATGEKDDESASSSECEAYECARIIKEEILGWEKEKYMVWDNPSSSLREPTYDDIAILLKKTSNQSNFEKALRLFNIPFTVSDNKSLTQDAVMCDFYSILQYSVYGDDDPLSFASLLRSPFVNMSDEDIEIVINNTREKKKREESVSEDGKKRLNILDELVTELKEKEEKESLGALIHYLWYERGYRFLIESERDNYSYAEHYDYLFSIASDYDASKKGLIAFLDAVRPTLGDVSPFKDQSILREKRSGVTIETIHKSKGLEYPIVFVSDMGGKNNSDRYTITRLSSSLPLLPYFVTKDRKLKNPVAAALKKEDNMMENAETKRVLYVAATRSEHHLIFTSVFGKKSMSNGSLTRPKTDSYNSMLQYFIEGIDFDFEAGSDIIETREFGAVKYYVFREKRKKSKKPEGIEKWYLEPRKLKEEKPIERKAVTSLETYEFSNDGNVTFLPSTEFDSILKEGEYEDEERKSLITEFGTLTHLLIESGVKNTDADTSTFFMDEKKRERIISSSIALRDGFLSSTFYKSLTGYRLYPERKILIKDGECIVEGIIDLLCISDEKIIIVDYKTDSVRIPERHRGQLDYYKKAIKTIYNNRKVETYLYYLRSREALLLE